ncbi:MAG: CHAT domain-containing protein, partial [Candidatus Eisenbacteria bacterium]|nr:CHAT domain-containing protein [Candidatus Eisenbacteria bacterium]
LAITLSNLGDHTAALRELLSAAEVQTAEADSFELASTTKSIGSAYFALQNYPRALESYREASKMAYDTGNIRVELEAMTNTGSTYINMGLPAKGVETLEEALAVAREVNAVDSEADILSLLGGTYETAGEYDNALTHYEQALEIDKDLGQSGVLAARYLNVGNALTALGRNSEGLEKLRKAASLAEAAGNREALWPCYLGIGDNFETADVLDSARVYNAKAIDILESLRSREASEDTKAASLGRRAYVYEAQVHVLAKLYASTDKQEWAAEAFTTAERGKARAFLDGLSESNIDLEDQIDPKLAAERQTLDRALNTVRYRLRQAEGTESDPDSVRSWKRQLRKLERAEGRLLEEIRIQSSAFASINTGSPHSLKELRRDLFQDKHDVLLQYSLGDSASYLWVITKKDIAFHTLPARSHIEEQVQALRAGLVSPQARNDESYLKAAQTLYNWLLATAANSVDKAKRVFVVPDGALQFVPMDVLLTKKVDPPSADLSAEARGKFFGELPFALKGKELRYGPSATGFAVMAKREDSGRVVAKDLLAVGDPTFVQTSSEDADASLAPLPFTRTEVEAIAKGFEESKRTILLGEKAQEATLAQPDFMSDFRILHFATHGLVNERRPERSRLALAAPQDETADGYLEASEIYRLKLNATLVVLSACETGLGKMIQGEGVLGLPRAFLYAGARNVVVSLWSVSDQSTAALMYAFYKNLGDKEPEAGRALSRAKDALRQESKFAHPFYWAAFSLIGP